MPPSLASNVSRREEVTDYVATVSSLGVRVVCATPGLRVALLAAGAAVVGDQLELRAASRPELARALQLLQRLGVPFGNEPAGWPPAAVYQQLREQGLVSGSVATISWRGPHEPLFGKV